MTASPKVTVLGVFVADTAYRAARQPRMGETLMGESFPLGPGGKGSNQAVASAKLGVETAFISRLGEDAFAEMALGAWKTAGVRPLITRSPESYTGAAYIFVDAESGDNAILVCPGAADLISEADVETAADEIRSSSVFVTQLEQPIPAARRALEIARDAGVITVFNPAPAAEIDDELFALCDYVTPNETEAEILTGHPVTTLTQAEEAAEARIARGAGAAVITLGEKGALLHGRGFSELVPSFEVGPVVETTGAGDAFNGGFAAALARGMAPADAVRFGCATAGISVTRPGTAPAMPTLAEVEAVLG